MIDMEAELVNSMNSSLFASTRERFKRFNFDWSRDVCFFFPSRRRHTRFDCDWSSDVSSDLVGVLLAIAAGAGLWRWHPLWVPAAPAVSAPGEDPEEIRLRRAGEARPNDAASRLALGQYYE